MDNDNKIENRELSNAQRHKDVMLFLNEELNNIQTSTSSNTYNLEKEYAKTKKNKSPFVILVLLLCVLITVGIAWGLSFSIAKQNQSITVNLEEFDALNLRALLDSVARVQDKYNVAVQERDMTKAAMDNELKKAESQRDDDLFVLESISSVDPESFASRRRAIIAEYDRAVAAIKEQYEEKIAELEAKVDEYQKELDSYDSSKVASAREQDKSGEYSLQDMERKKLIANYESQIKDLQIQIDALSTNKSTRSAVNQVSTKYQAEINRLDPVVKDEQANQLASDNKNKFVKTYNAQDIIDSYNLEDDELAAVLTEYQELYDSYKYLRNYVASVPQKKSIPDFVAATNKLVDQMGQTFSKSTVDLQIQKGTLQKTIEDMNAQIEELNSSHQQELSEIEQKNAQEKSALEQYYKRINYNYTDCLNQMLSYTDSSAVVAYATAKDSIVVYVVPRARLTLKPEGTNVEIYGTKLVTGRIVPFENGYYYFVPALDEEGNEIDFNFKDIVPGALVKILSVE